MVECALGFDVGAKRIGVAVGSAISGGARPLAVVEVREGVPDWRRLEHLLREWRPGALVVGDPRTLDEANPDQPARRRAQRFARELLARFALPVHLVDERRSSQEAARRFAAARAAGTRRRKDGEEIDAVAAAVIVERWLDDPGEATSLMPDAC